MVILLALAVSAAVLAFAGVTPDLAAPTYALVALLALMWAGKLFAAKVVSWKHSPLHIPIVVFVAYAVARYFYSPLEYEARLELIGIVCCAAVYFIAASNFYRARERAWFLWALLLLALVESILGIWQFATHANYIIPGWERPQEYANRAGGTFICPNHLATFLEIVLTLLIGRLVFFRSSTLSVQQLALRKLAFGYGALILVAALITTLSRAGWAAAAVALGSVVFWGGWNFRALWPRLATVLVAIAVVATLCFGIPSVRHRIYLTMATPDKPAAELSLHDESLGGRTMLWESTLQIIRDHPAFGTGGESWEWMHPQYRNPGIQTHPIYAHSDILQFTSDYGVAGGILLAAVFCCFFWQVLTLAREGNSGDHRSFAIGAALATTAILIHSWFDFSMHIFANALLLSAIFGFTAAAEDNRQIFRRVELGRFTRYALGTAIIALCVGAVWFVTPTVLGSRYTRLGDGAKQEVEWDQAQEYYRRAIAVDPKCWQHYRNLADTCRLKLNGATGAESRSASVWLKRP